MVRDGERDAVGQVVVDGDKVVEMERGMLGEGVE